MVDFNPEISKNKNDLSKVNSKVESDTSTASSFTTMATGNLFEGENTVSSITLSPLTPKIDPSGPSNHPILTVASPLTPKIDPSGPSNQPVLTVASPLTPKIDPSGPSNQPVLTVASPLTPKIDPSGPSNQPILTVASPLTPNIDPSGPSDQPILTVASPIANDKEKDIKDDTGNVREKRFYKYNSETGKYDLLYKKIQIDTQTGKQESESIYDSKGQLTNLKVWDQNTGNYVCEQKLQYNDDGSKVRTSYDANGNIEQIKTTTYQKNADGTKTATVIYTDGGNPAKQTNKATVQIDSNGKTTQSDWYDTNNKLKRQELYTNGKYSTIYTYDKNGNKVKESDYTYTNGKAVVSNYKLDSSGNKIDNSYTYTRYKYDSNGNVTEKDTYDSTGQMQKKAINNAALGDMHTSKVITYNSDGSRTITNYNPVTGAKVTSTPKDPEGVPEKSTSSSSTTSSQSSSSANTSTSTASSRATGPQKAGDYDPVSQKSKTDGSKNTNTSTVSISASDPEAYARQMCLSKYGDTSDEHMALVRAELQAQYGNL